MNLEKTIELEAQTKEMVKQLQVEEMLLEDKLVKIKAKIKLEEDILIEIRNQRENLMIEEDIYLDGIVGFTIDGVNYVPFEAEPARLLTESMVDTKFEDTEYDVSKDDLSNHLAYKFVEATKKWLATKAPNPKRLMIPRIILDAMVNEEHAIPKMK